MQTEYIMKDKKRVLIIGLDGGTFEIIKPFVKEGYLPNIERVMNQGCYGILESTIPPVTAPAWASFMTGKNPGKHGILQFFEFSQNERQLAYNFHTGKFLNFSHIKESTIFELLGESGKKVISINIPMTYPPREINGKMISCWLTPPGARDYTYPLSLREEYPDYRIDQYFGERIFALTPSGKQIVADEFFADINDVLDKRAQTGLSMVAKEDWDLFMICFTETDRVHHFFWRAVNQNHPEFDTPSVRRERCMFIDFYKRLDIYIGGLISWAERKGAIACIMSDHGFGPPPPKRLHMNYYLKKHAYIIVNYSSENNPSPFLNKLKEEMWKYKLGRILLQDLLGSKVESCLMGRPEDVDWYRTKAWSVCLNNNVGGIFFNYDSIDIPIDEFRGNLISEMFSVVDSRKKCSIIQQIMTREKLFSGGKTSNFPDLVYILNPDYEAGIDGGFDLFASSLVSLNPYPSGRGNHNMEGIYIFYGSDIRENGESGKRSIMGILPTVLYYLGVPIPDDLDGRPILDVFKEDMIDHKKPVYKKIKPLTYPMVSTTQNQGSNDEVIIEEKLKNLGYL